MDPARIVKTSKFLSKVLRHNPELLRLELDDGGWADVALLLRALAERNRALTREELEEVVRENDKQRFAMSEDGARIRATQGHSIPVDLGLEAVEPPETLFHGTVGAYLASIRDEGLARGARHHVHLSPTREIARSVGARRGRPVVLEVEALRMWTDGHVFHLTANGVWLTERVPPGYLRFPLSE
jgi:putative RNA 2'-phosphotransferase